MDRQMRKHQADRRAFLDMLDKAITVGAYVPQYRDYVVYHCYTTLEGDRPVSYKRWLDERGMVRDSGRGLPAED